MTREEALKKISELSCAYQHIRMTDCPHCKEEVESMVKMLMQVEKEKEE